MQVFNFPRTLLFSSITVQALWISCQLPLVQIPAESSQDAQLGRVVETHLQSLALGTTVLEPELDVLALQSRELLPVEGRKEID